MPRKTEGRTLGLEDWIAERIATLREANGWSYEGLAKRMKDVGCPIAPSAIYKTEKGEPRRRIVVDELVGYARVFGVSLDYLIERPTDSAMSALLDYYRLATRLRAAEEDVARAQDEAARVRPGVESARDLLFERLRTISESEREAVLSELGEPLGSDLRAAWEKASRSSRRKS